MVYCRAVVSLVGERMCVFCVLNLSCYYSDWQVVIILFQHRLYQFIFNRMKLECMKIQFALDSKFNCGTSKPQ